MLLYISHNSINFKNNRIMEKKTFDFSKVEILNLEGQRMGIEQLRAEVCNALYMQGQDITECELGQKLWHAKDDRGAFTPVEISEEEEKKLRQQFEKYPYLIRTALLKVLNS